MSRRRREVPVPARDGQLRLGRPEEAGGGRAGPPVRHGGDPLVTEEGSGHLQVSQGRGRGEGGGHCSNTQMLSARNVRI